MAVRNPAGAAIRFVLTGALKACTKMPEADEMNCTRNIPQGNRQAQKKGPVWWVKLAA
jgi:hypothetical protein